MHPEPARPPAPPETDALDFQLLNEIGIIAQLSSSAFERVMPHDLTQAQFSVLNHGVRLGDGWTPARLAAAFQVSRGTMTSTLKRLEAKGFVRIEPDADDGRSKRVFLTEAGRAARQAAIVAALPLLQDVGGVLTRADRAGLLAALTKLRVWLDAHR